MRVRTALFLGFFGLLATACSKQGEGERCDLLLSGETADCESGLVCTAANALSDNSTDRCCPPEGQSFSDDRCAPKSSIGNGGSGNGGSGNGGSTNGGSTNGGTGGAAGSISIGGSAGSTNGGSGGSTGGAAGSAGAAGTSPGGNAAGGNSSGGTAGSSGAAGGGA